MIGIVGGGDGTQSSFCTVEVSPNGPTLRVYVYFEQGVVTETEFADYPDWQLSPHTIRTVRSQSAPTERFLSEWNGVYIAIDLLTSAIS
jgi:hypothetical protein